MSPPILLKRRMGKDEKQTSVISGGVAQLGEHLPCKQGVDSSILFVSTSAPERERQKQVGCKGLDRDGHRYGLIAQVVRARA